MCGGSVRSSAERGLRVCHQELLREVKSCRQDGTSGQDSEFVWLEGEAKVAIRMEHLGKQDSEVFQLE